MIVKSIEERPGEVRVKVENIGEADAPNCILRLTVRFPGKAEKRFQVNVQPLKAGKDRVLTIKTPGVQPDKAGTTLAAAVDVGNRIKEADEDNNLLFKDVK
ncbi:MAG: hypothetical protein K2W96_13860 [Gemmataceae bacterium]|nr:hypothetical protein [Gemmataceae bacterium]